MIKKTLLTIAAFSTFTGGISAQELRQQTGILGAGQPAEMSIVRKEAKKMGLKNFDLQSRQVDGRLAIDGFSAQLGTGTIQGQGLVDWSRQNDRHNLNITFNSVDLPSLFNAFEIKQTSKIQGTASGTINVQWNGVRGLSPRETMNGSLNIKIGPGSMSNSQMLNQLASYTGIPSLQTVEFHSADVQATIRQGTMSITAINLNGPSKSAKGTGLMDLRSEDSRIKFEIYADSSLTAQSTVPAIRAAGGKGKVKLPVPVVLYGKIRQPNFDFTLQ